MVGFGGHCGVKEVKAKKIGLVEAVYPKERLLTMALTHLKKQGKKQTFKESLEHFRLV